MRDQWISDRARAVEASGIRKVFELARSLSDPINLSIGQPHFDVPGPIKAAAHAAIDRGLNSYTVTQGIPDLRDRLRADVLHRYPGSDREVLITSGTSGGLLLAILASVNPGDEVVFLDPYFVMYPHLVTMAGGTSVIIDTAPDLAVDVDRVRAALTPRTRLILVNSPANPTGLIVPRETLHALARLAEERGILLLSDEIYSAFSYDAPHASPAEVSADVVVLDGFSKTYGMTGWRLGYAHGPRRFIEEMAKLQQFTFVCAPSMVQYAGLTALDEDMAGPVADYHRKRDRLTTALRDHYEFVMPGGAFYCYPKVPGGRDGSAFVTEAIRSHQLLLIPGITFSRHDTHFRISYAVDDRTLDRGIAALVQLAR